MADIALDAEGLRRDRQRYHAVLQQAELQITAWNERADHLQQAIDGLDHLLVLAGCDPALDGGVPQGPPATRGVAPLPAAAAPPPAAQPAAAGPGPSAPAPAAVPAATPAPARKARPPKKAARVAPAKRAPSATATPASPEPVEAPAAAAAETPKGTDALRLVFEGDPQRSWSLAELIDALASKGWLPASRRPEEGVRISLKRLAERGGAFRTDDGRWRHAGTSGGSGSSPERTTAGTWPPAEVPPALPEDAGPVADEPEASDDDAAPARPAPPSTPAPRSASFGLPVGGTVTEL